MPSKKSSNSLEEAGIKKTKARLAILSFLQNKSKPKDVLEIIDYLKDQQIDADKVTVYRILEIFTAKGLIKRLEFQEGKFRYEGAGEHHHHLICMNCKKVEDIDIENDVSKHEKYIFDTKKFKVLNHSLEFFGLCENC